MRLLLIRHAESMNNRLYADTGASLGRHADPVLTELGHAQARALAEFARQDPTFQGVTHLYASLTTRAVQTAAPLAAALGLPVQGLTAAHETGGLFLRSEEGVPYAVPGRTHADLLRENGALLWPADLEAGAPWAGGFEAPDDEEAFGRRAALVLGELRARHEAPRPEGTGAEGVGAGAPAEAAGCVALITHGHFSQYLLRHLIGHGGAYFRLYNTATTLLTLPAPDAPSKWGPIAEWVNRFDHLAPEQVSL